MKRYIKWIIAGSLVAVFIALYAFDYATSYAYSYEIVNCTSEKIVADGGSPTKITVRLSRDAKPVEGHKIDVVVSNGTLRSSSYVTNGNGEITIVYYAYVYLDDKLTPLSDVTFTLSDDSNSTFFTVPAKFDFTIPAVKPDDEIVWEDWQNIGKEGD